MTVQTNTTLGWLNGPEKKNDILALFDGKDLVTLRTPALVIDRKIFAENCAAMHQRAKNLGAQFRAHLKTHKTAEGTRLQLASTVDHTHSVVVSTLVEAWEVVRAGLVADQTVKDVLYGLPVALNKVDDLAALREEMLKHQGILHLLVDHPDQVRFLESFEGIQSIPKRWSVFIKVDGGQRRAGVCVGSSLFDELLSAAFNSQAISVYGFYQHAGNSYASKSKSDAVQYLLGEIEAVNSAAKAGIEVLKTSGYEGVHQQPFVLSVGSTPTAHSASEDTRRLLAGALNGTLELHAGNYPMLDLQQKSTGMVQEFNIAQRVLATVVSYYPGRGNTGQDEALVDAGAIAFSKDTGPSGTFGEVLNSKWTLARLSQEHGILSFTGEPGEKPEQLELGSQVEIVGQHACLIAAAYPWYYIVDKDIEGGRKIVDIWVPWKGW